MPDFKSLDSIYLILAFLVPGLIASFVRAQFITGRMPSHTEAALSYLALSLIYYAVTLPAVELTMSVQEAGHKSLTWIAIVVIGPAIFGLLLGINAQSGLMHRLFRLCRLNPVHVMPTAWDWKACTMHEEWVLVVLKDGTKFAGFCGTGSFMSTDQKERDIYIERIYDIDDDDKWHARENGLLIAAGEVRTIEFWPCRKELKHEQEQTRADAPSRHPNDLHTGRIPASAEPTGEGTSQAADRSTIKRAKPGKRREEVS